MPTAAAWTWVPPEHPPPCRTPRGALDAPTQPSSTATWVSDTPTCCLLPILLRLVLGVALGLEICSGANNNICTPLLLHLPFSPPLAVLRAVSALPCLSVCPQESCEPTLSPARPNEGKGLGAPTLSPAWTRCLPHCQKSISSEQSPSRSRGGHASTVGVTPRQDPAASPTTPQRPICGTRRGLPAPPLPQTDPPGDTRSP